MSTADQQEEYWKKANEDRMKKLGRKKQEKGSEKVSMLWVENVGKIVQ